MAVSSDQRGFSLVETIVALSILTAGLLSLSGVFTDGLRRVHSSPNDLIASRKAAEAMESVFSARDTNALTWAQIDNVAGFTGSDGGVFLDGPQALRLPGPDGLINTADDGEVETVITPGPDGLLGTPDDVVVALNNFTREIEIRDITLTLRRVRVIVRFQDGSTTRECVLMTYISTYA